MTEQFLLMVFIGLVALALVGIAVSVGFVAWEVVKLLREARAMLMRVREVGELAANDVLELREKVRSEGFKIRLLLDTFINVVLKRFVRPRARSATKKVRVEDVEV